jgi:hypothetical protein
MRLFSSVPLSCRFCASCERLYLQQKYQRPNIDEKLGITNENHEVIAHEMSSLILFIFI